jgi:ABC-2 type transport system permease protein
LRAPPPRIEALNPLEADSGTRRQDAFFLSFILFGSVSTLGYAMGSSVATEKSSRVIELLVSAVRPAQLLVGKFFGLMLATLTQLALLAVITIGENAAAGGIPIDRANIELAVMGAAWAAVVFAFFAALYAIVGASVSRQEDLQSAAQPLSFLATAMTLVGLLAFAQPDTALVRNAAFIPLLSPIPMMIRWAGGEASLAQALLSLALMAVAVVIVALLASRSFSNALLRFGGRVPLREAIRRTSS